MSALLNILDDKEADLQAQIDALNDEIQDVRAAKHAIMSRRNERATDPVARTHISIDDAILRAVGTGRQTPMLVHQYIASTYGVDTTINSVRTRLSRLGGEKKLDRNWNGWVLPNENGPPEGGPDAEEVDASSNEDRMPPGWR